MPKKTKEIEHIDFPSEYKVLGADLSLKQPGFCVLSISDGEIKDVKLYSVNNKQDKKKTHGQLLDEIGDKFTQIFPVDCNVFIVRENEIMKVKVPSERSLSKVVGLLDWMAWALFDKEWYSIYPVTVKKLITGSGRAEKEEVARCLKYYVGEQTYKCDDESDAVAVAIAWLIQQGQIKPKEIE